MTEQSNTTNETGKEAVQPVFPKITLSTEAPSDALIANAAEQYKSAFAGNTPLIEALKAQHTMLSGMPGIMKEVLDGLQSQIDSLAGDERTSKRGKMLGVLTSDMALTVEPLGILLIALDAARPFAGEQVREAVEKSLAVLEHARDLDSQKASILLGLARKIGAILTTMSDDHGEVIVREKARKRSTATGESGSTGRRGRSSGHNFLTINSETKFLSAPASVRQAAARSMLAGTEYASGNDAVTALGLEKNASSANGQLKVYGLTVVSTPVDTSAYKSLLEANVANGSKAA